MKEIQYYFREGKHADVYSEVNFAPTHLGGGILIKFLKTFP